MSPIDIDALEDQWDDDLDPVGPRGRPQASVAARRQRAGQTPGRVVAVDRGHVDVGIDGVVLRCRYGGAMRGSRVVVGDRVLVVAPRHEGDEARVVERLDRTTVLARTGDDATDDERVVVANADAIVCVVGVDNLELGLRFADRVLVAASVGGLAASIVVNKIDLVDAVGATHVKGERTGAPALDRDAVARALAPYRPAVEHLIATSAVTGEGIDELAATLLGRWTAFTGHSGVGKSSLFNRLVPDADRTTGELGRRGGRHTTVAALALSLPGDGGWLVDTPGVRSFGLGTVTADDLWRHIPELAGLECALDDCAHDGEPGCAIATAGIDPVRLAAYRRLLASLRAEG